MGWSLSWAAVRGKTAEDLWRELGLRPTGNKSDTPEGPFCSTRAGEGWIVVCAFHDDRFIEGDLLASLSAHGEAVGCYVEEHVMQSRALGRKGGALQWSVTHDPRKSIDHLEAVGNVPPEFAELAAAALARPRRTPTSADLAFDVPADLAKSVVGFHHEDDGFVFEALESIRPVERRSPFTPSELAELARKGLGLPAKRRITPLNVVAAILATTGAIVFLDRLVTWLRSL